MDFLELRSKILIAILLSDAAYIFGSTMDIQDHISEENCNILSKIHAKFGVRVGISKALPKQWNRLASYSYGNRHWRRDVQKKRVKTNATETGNDEEEENFITDHFWKYKINK